ncbi:Dcp1p-Dcp2p decapping enzyme complex alpha subunit [Cryptotrichosporon argae]
MPTHSRIPDIPGERLANETQRGFLNEHVARLCGLGGSKFPGAQPVSFTTASLDLLASKDFWVCEKSDGVRVLLLVLFNGSTGNQEVWLIDRKQQYFLLDGIHFTHWARPDDPLTDTIVDGELIIDVDPETGHETLRFYAFDCLVLHGENIMQKGLVKRYARLRDWVVQPYEKALQRYPEWRESLPFEIIAKKQELSYYTTTVLNVHIPKLQHGHDGLIFTCAETPYVTGTDENILKWKPPSENSIDFKLELRFPPSAHDANEPDYFAKPAFLLNTWLGSDQYDYFDEMLVEDEQWEEMKASGEQYDDRIVEVCWDNERGAWTFLRVRDDKLHGNHRSIADKILVSIQDGVEIKDVLARMDAIRQAWKARHSGEGATGAAAPPGQAWKGTMPPTPGARGAVGHGGFPVTPGYPATPGVPTPGPAPVMAGLKR